ncbi:hypothetical protein [Aliamphritea spongicola]|nr:hypothetical protein [Aliamphritea spongicola]
MSDEEAQLVGRWEWHKTQGYDIEEGYLILNDDRTYQYAIESKTRFEGLSEITDGTLGAWRLVDKSLCFHAIGDAENSRCLFVDVEVDGQRLRFELDGFFRMDGLEAVRKSE